MFKCLSVRMFLIVGVAVTIIVTFQNCGTNAKARSYDIDSEEDSGDELSFGADAGDERVPSINEPDPKFDGNPPSDDNKQNVIMVLLDDIGVDSFACTGETSSDIRMPNIEARCKDAVIFRRGFGHPNCTPSRAAILTGLYGFRTGMGAAIGGGLSTTKTLDTKFTTLHKYLRDNLPTVATMAAGKWHLSTKDALLSHPLDVGVGHQFTRQTVKPYLPARIVDGVEEAFIGQYGPAVDVNHVLEWASKMDRRGRQFFGYLALDSVHTPYHVPPANLHSFKNLKACKLKGRDVKEVDQQRQVRMCYLAMLEALDTLLERLMRGLPKNTVVIIMSDNGTYERQVRAPFDPLRAKSTLYKGGIHVPLMVFGPKVAAGVRHRKVIDADVFATVAEIMGAPVPADKKTDSLSFMSSLVTKDAHGAEDIQNEPLAYSEIFGYLKHPENNGWTIMNNQVKYIAFENGRDACYDYKADPLEKNKLALSTAECQRLKESGKELRSTSRLLIH